MSTKLIYAVDCVPFIVMYGIHRAHILSSEFDFVFSFKKAFPLFPVATVIAKYSYICMAYNSIVCCCTFIYTIDL